MFGGNGPAQISAVPAIELMTAEVRPALLVLLAAVILLFLAATANIASLQLGRATTRRREMAILQAIGWSWRHIREQVLVENFALTVIGTAAGLVVALMVVLALGHVSVTVDLPWDLSSTPHFIPQAAINRTQTITAPLSISLLTASVATAGSVLISVLAVLAVLAMPRPQPWSLLRSE